MPINDQDSQYYNRSLITKEDKKPVYIAEVVEVETPTPIKIKDWVQIIRIVKERHVGLTDYPNITQYIGMSGKVINIINPTDGPLQYCVLIGDGQRIFYFEELKLIKS
jgi:hypothetical protein